MTRRSGKSNINQLVWKFIREDIALQKDLQRKLINMRALAKFLINKYAINSSLDAVISAIRRFHTQEEFKEEEKQLVNIFQNSSVSTRNNVACITLSISIKELFDRVYSIDGLNLDMKITTGYKELKIVIDTESIDKILALFPKKSIKSIFTDLSEIHLVASEKIIKTKGALARMANELALANINVEEIIICPPEFFIYVKQKDIVKAHDSILKLVQKA